MNPPMGPLGLTNKGPGCAVQKTWGRRQAGEHGVGAAAPHLQPQECLHSRLLLRQSKKEVAGPTATLASRVAHTSLAGKSPPASAAARRPPESGGSHSRHWQAVPAGELLENRSCPTEPHTVVAIGGTARPRPQRKFFL
ncbi:hypothetical protein NDU88_006966 [Pleurodeles waltl]|uniref:Uncharacterized protein n=1 Tax=Pleurodeles waltl TaxID=8319 RepID=A0AAV7PMX8_PLEWA|nr:hypothetical protein NDU88_006966 [Pleurodeles waltl]